MEEPRRQRERQQRWRIVAAVFCVFVAIRLLIVAEGSIPLLTWIFYPLYCVYALAPLVLAVALVRKGRGQRVAPLPILPERWASDRRSIYVLAALVVLGTLLREGAFGSDASVDFHAFRAQDKMQIHNSNQTPCDSDADCSDGICVLGTCRARPNWDNPVFAGRPANCNLDCTPAGQTCDAILASIHCPSEGTPSEPVQVTGSIDLGAEAWCYTPWYKEATVEFSVRVAMSVAQAGSSNRRSVALTGQIEQDSFGPMSCRSFRKRIGGRIGRGVAERIDDVLIEN